MYDKAKIDELLFDVLDLAKRIKMVDKLVSTVQNQDLQKSYDEDLLDMIHAYKTMARVLEVELEHYIKFEKENNLPIALNYRKVLRELKKID